MAIEWIIETNTIVQQHVGAAVNQQEYCWPGKNWSEFNSSEIAEKAKS